MSPLLLWLVQPKKYVDIVVCVCVCVLHVRLRRRDEPISQSINPSITQSIVSTCDPTTSKGRVRIPAFRKMSNQTARTARQSVLTLVSHRLLTSSGEVFVSSTSVLDDE